MMAFSQNALISVKGALAGTWSGTALVETVVFEFGVGHPSMMMV